MSPHTQLLFALTFAILMAMACTAFLCWLVWALCWDLYDHLMQQRTRRRFRRNPVIRANPQPDSRIYSVRKER